MGVRNSYTSEELFQFYERIATQLSEMTNVNQPLEHYIQQYFQGFPSVKMSQVPSKEITNFLLKHFPQKLQRFTRPNRRQSLENIVKLENCSTEDDINNDNNNSNNNHMADSPNATKLQVETFSYDYFFSASNSVETVYDLPVKMDRRTALYKRSHRASNSLHKYVAIEGAESELPVNFAKIVNDIFAYGNSYLECYDLILNSLAKFYSTKTWSTNVQNCVAGFLRRYFLKSGSDICAEVWKSGGLLSADSEADSTQVEEDELFMRMKVACMLELFCCKVESLPVKDCFILNTLRQIRFIYGDEQLRKFVNEILRKFGDLMMDELQAICDTFDIPMVRTKRKISNADSTRASAARRSRSPVKKHRKRISSSDSASKLAAVANSLPKANGVSNGVCNDFENEDDDDEDSSESYSNDIVLRDRIFEGMTNFSSLSPSNNEPAKNGSASSGRSKVGRPTSQRASSNAVNNTPKISTFFKKDYVPCYRRIDSSSDEDKQKSSNAKETSSNSRGSTRRASLQTGAQTKRVSQTEVKKSDRKPKKKVSTPTSKVVKPEKEKPVKLAPIFVQRNSNGGSNADSPVVDTNTAAAFLTDNTVAQYKKKMEAIRGNARSLKNSQEVFYGRANSRKGLFDDESDEFAKPSSSSVRETRSDTLNESCNAKNRSGRTINAPPVNSVFIAHTLLNVRNMQPLSAFKASQVGAAAASDSADFRLRKFVKPANRAERRRIKKMKKSTTSQAVASVEDAAQEQDDASRDSANNAS